jgi:hypothetical protein
VGNSTGLDSSKSSESTTADTRMNPTEPSRVEAPKPSLNPKVEGSNPSRPTPKTPANDHIVSREIGLTVAEATSGC